MAGCQGSHLNILSCDCEFWEWPPSHAESRPSPHLAPVLLGLCHHLRSPWHWRHQPGEGRVCSVILSSSSSPTAPTSAALLSLQPVEKPFPFCGRDRRSTVELLVSQVMEFFPFIHQPSPSQSPCVRGPLLLYLEPALPSLPHPLYP